MTNRSVISFVLLFIGTFAASIALSFILRGGLSIAALSAWTIGGVVALTGNTYGVPVARRDLVYPKVETALVREAAKEVGVLLVDEEVCVVDRNRGVRAGSQA